MSGLCINEIDIYVVHRDVKNLRIEVCPPDGNVKVCAPTWLKEDQIRLAVIHHLPRIKRQREQLRNAERYSVREFVGGESIYLFGSRYRLRIIEGYDRVEIKQGWLLTAHRKQFERWQRDQLKDEISRLIEKWSARIGCRIPEFGIRRMKTKWASCRNGHITFNSRLVEKNPRCIEYVVARQMVCLLHGKAFGELMGDLMPNWEFRRKELNDAPLEREVV